MYTSEKKYPTNGRWLMYPIFLAQTLLFLSHPEKSEMGYNKDSNLIDLVYSIMRSKRKQVIFLINLYYKMIHYN